MPDVSTARIAFAGTPTFARTILAHLLEAGIRPVLVLTQPDRPTGRGRKLSPSPVKMLASEYSLPMHQPARLRTDEQVRPLQEAAPDLFVVAAYGLILPQRVLDIPRLGCVNVHASVLPRWRGAAPIERAIMAGDQASGVSLMRMEAGLDTGPLYEVAHTDIGADETGEALEARLAALGGQRLVARLPELLAGSLVPTAQDDAAATYAHKLERPDARIDWSRPAEEIARRIRALSGRLSVEARLGEARLQLLGAVALDDAEVSAPVGCVLRTRPGIDVRCASGCLRITRLRFTDRGKGTALSAADAANGFKDVIHTGACFDVDG